MKRQAAIGAMVLLVAVALAALGFVLWPQGNVLGPSPPATGGVVSRFSAPRTERSVLTIEAATDVSFMRPFILDFQAINPDVTVVYVDFISSGQFARAQRACARRLATADLYLTVSTDSLVKLANDGCAATLPKWLTGSLPAWAQWRRNVVAFSLEPAVFIYNTQAIPAERAPKDHLQLIEMLRADPQTWRGRIGTYDIEASGSGYVYASVDAHQTATYGRLIESFGRSEIRTYCCSNTMADAVARREILFAYNVQMSYAAAAQRAGKPIGVILPNDYQAILTRSVMMTRDARHREQAIAFIQYLTSARGQKIAAEQLAPLGGPTLGRNIPTNGQLSPIAVGPVLLGLADEARRSRFIKEWTNAIAPGPPPGTVNQQRGG